MSKKILIIDDDESTRKLMQYTLSKEGYDDISVALSAEEGLARVKNDAPDIVILDVFLPDKNGIELCKNIKADKNLCSKVLLITGSLDEMESDDAKSSGADSILVKTSDYEMLIEELRKLEGR